MAFSQGTTAGRYCEEGGLRERRTDGGGGAAVAPLRVLSAFSFLCLLQQSAHRHSTMKVPSPAGRRERRQPNLGLMSV